MKFKKLTLESMDEVRPYLGRTNTRVCDFTVGGIFMWRDLFLMEYAVCDDVLFIRMYDDDGNLFYNIPLGGDLRRNTDFLLDECGGAVSFSTVPEEYRDLLCAMPYRTEVHEQEKYADYLYSAREMSDLHGKKFHSQRNQIKHFLIDNEDWSYNIITQENIHIVRDFFMNKYLPHASDGMIETEENKKTAEVLDNYMLYDMQGGYLTANGETVGFSVCEKQNDTLIVHIEKADRSVRGVYQMLAAETAARFAAELMYVNREDDMGDEGLKRYKLSYHPIMLLKKYIVKVMRP